MKVVKLGGGQMLRAAIALCVLCSGGIASAQMLARPPKEEYLCGVQWASRDAFQYLLNYFGNPSRVEMGSGALPGEAASTTSSPGSLPGTSGGSGGSAASSDPEFGLVTWIYDNPMNSIGDTLMITFDEQDAGSIRTIRLLGYNSRTPVQLRAWTAQRIVLGSDFATVLWRYGYPDRTLPVATDEFIVYYFTTNVAFHFRGDPLAKNRGSWLVTSITVGPGPDPAYSPPGAGAAKEILVNR